jgi:hypothetical protein
VCPSCRRSILVRRFALAGLLGLALPWLGPFRLRSIPRIGCPEYSTALEGTLGVLGSCRSGNWYRSVTGRR